MEYYTKLHTEHEPMQITKEEARHFLEYCYIKEAVDSGMCGQKLRMDLFQLRDSMEYASND